MTIAENANVSNVKPAEIVKKLFLMGVMAAQTNPWMGNN